MEMLTAPSPLQMTGNVAENWKRFKQRYELYRVASGASKREASLQVPLLLHVMGEDALEVFNSFTWERETDSKDYEKVIKKFQDYFTPKKNVVLERFHFNNISQNDQEDFDRFLTQIKNQASLCEFGELKDQLIRDRIVVGIKNKAVQERMLREKDLSLDNAITIAKTAEVTKNHLQQLHDHPTVSEVTRRSTQKKTQKKTQKNRPQPKAQESNGKHKCRRCDNMHESRKCPAYGVQCHKCKGMNHFAKCCLSKKKVDQVQIEEPDEQEPEFDMGTVDIDAVAKKGQDWIRDIELNGTTIAMKLDTGAQANILSDKDFDKLQDKPKLEKTSVKLKGVGGHHVRVKGKCSINAQFRNMSAKETFYVVPNVKCSLLGKSLCEKLQLVKLVCAVDESDTGYSTVLSKYKDVFDGLGCIPGEHSIVTDETVSPVVHPCRKVPFALQQDLKEELERMESAQVIQKISEPTNWVNSLVVVKKKTGKLRVCLDPRDLNRAIKRQHFKLPTREEIMSRFAGAKIFSKMDASQGFYQLKLDKESSLKCTFNTPFGRYRYLRLPFGISSAPEVYSHAMRMMFEGMSNVDTSMDDIIVWGKTKQEHDSALLKVLEVAQKNNLKLNRQKCEFGVSELTFLGDILSSDGIKPDPIKVAAINNMEKPSDKQGVQRFLGMVTYLAKWIPDLSTVTNPLRQLLIEKNEWQWGPEQDKAWESLKNLISSPPVLQFYDPQKPIKLSSDASKNGLGAVIMQLHDDEWKPVAYAARAMLDAETRYAQIEKELLSIVFACERFHQFIYGTSVQAETDHKPLVTLFTKPLNMCPLRVQRMLLRLQKYDLNVFYTPGKYLLTADTLSRSNKQERSAETLVDDVQLHIDMVINTMPISDQRLAEIKRETENDPELKSVMDVILKGWPSNRSSCKPETVSYWNERDQLSTADGIILRGTRIVIPRTMRKSMLKKIHEGHMGIEKCKRRAREHVFWPGINAHITEMVESCTECQMYSRNNIAEPLKPHEIPTRPWQKVGTDLFCHDKKDYLVIVDYMSGYPELLQLRTVSSNAVISSMKSVFARFGVPDVVMSDNGPQYSSSEFADFAKDWEFKHITSSPHYPQSNGMAESAVKAMKNIVKKSNDVYKALLAYRTTPLQHGYSPSSVMMSRNIKGTLPTHPSRLTTKSYANLTEERRRQHESQKAYFDEGKKPLSTLRAGDSVRIRNEKTGDWATTGIVKDADADKRSYTVQADNGAEYRRNRVHLKPQSMNEHSKLTPMADPPCIPETQHPSALTECASSSQESVSPQKNVASSPTPPRRSTRERKQPQRLIEIKE